MCRVYTVRPICQPPILILRDSVHTMRHMRKTARLHIVCDEAEKVRWQEAARAARRSLSDFIRLATEEKALAQKASR